MSHMGKRCRKAASAAVLLAVSVGIAAYTYLNMNYPAHSGVMSAMTSGETVQVYETESNVVVFAPEEPEAGLVFYPGGKVEHTSYAPLLRALAEDGIVCVLPEMPFDLAVLDADAAKRARETVSGIEDWYIGGHSLGGAMAANYAADHPEEYKGLVLLAAYATKDLKSTDLKVISLYGSEDQVLDLEKYAQYRENLPEDTTEQVLDGGNHAQFGGYGPQDGDGTAKVSLQEQIDWAANIISEEILK